MIDGPRTRLRAVARRVKVAVQDEQDVRARRAPIDRHTVVYESFAGNGMLCNPEAIFRALLAAPDQAAPAARLGAVGPRAVHRHDRRVRGRPAGPLRAPRLPGLLPRPVDGQVPGQQRDVSRRFRQARGAGLPQHLARHAAQGDGLRRAARCSRHPQRRAQLRSGRLPAGPQRRHGADVSERLPDDQHLPGPPDRRGHAAHRPPVRRAGPTEHVRERLARARRRARRRRSRSCSTPRPGRATSTRPRTTSRSCACSSRRSSARARRRAVPRAAEGASARLRPGPRRRAAAGRPGAERRPHQRRAGRHRRARHRLLLDLRRLPGHRPAGALPRPRPRRLRGDPRALPAARTVARTDQPATSNNWPRSSTTSVRATTRTPPARTRRPTRPRGSATAGTRTAAPPTASSTSSSAVRATATTCNGRLRRRPEADPRAPRRHAPQRHHVGGTVAARQHRPRPLRRLGVVPLLH